MLLLWLQEKKQQNQSHAHITLPTPFPLDYTPRKCMRGECKEVGTRSARRLASLWVREIMTSGNW